MKSPTRAVAPHAAENLAVACNKCNVYKSAAEKAKVPDRAAATFGQGEPERLGASERVWLRALESHARNTKAVANPSLEQALAAERGLVGPLQPKQDRLVLEYLALPPVLAGARLYQEQAAIPAMREEPRNQRPQTVQPSYPALVGRALDVRDGALGGLLHMRSVYSHRLRIVPQADDRD